MSDLRSEFLVSSACVRIGTLLDDRWDVRELAGEGGMGAVYRALDRRTGKAVAVKVLTGRSPADHARFDREARVIERVAHPNVVALIDRGRLPDGAPFLVLEWLDGATLEARLAEVVPSIEDALACAVPLARALGHAHALGVVHRDVKPSNVFLLGGAFDHPKLLDFGVARVLDPTRIATRTGAALGTPAYMAPEQARGLKLVGPRADVYALGCLLFECLTGKPPFTGEDVMAILAKVLFEDPPRVSTLAPAVSPELEALVDRLLAKDPAARPADGDEAAALLEAIASGAKAGLPDRASRPPRPLTEIEERLVAVVAAAPGAGTAAPATDVSRDAPTIEAEGVVPHDALAEEADRLGGRFARLADGSSIAVFEGQGSAVDLATRAARCALAFRAKHAGMTVGLVMGSSARARVPVGAVIDKAAALIEEARRDPLRRVCVDALCADLLEQRFEIERDEAAEGAARGGGGSARLAGERAEPRATRLVRGVATPFVGRARELELLASLERECVEALRPRVALVTGAAGVGKSRLCEEWIAALRGRRPDAVIWSGRGDPLGSGAPLSLLGNAVHRAAGLINGEPREAAEDKLRALARLSVSPDEVARVAAFLGEITGAPFVSEIGVELAAARADLTLMGDQVRRAFEDLVFGITARAPLVLILEDAHFGDAATFRLLGSLERRLDGRPLLAVAVGRPELATLEPALGSAARPLRLGLTGLPRRAGRELALAILGEAQAGRADRVVEHAAGNPFYIEELARFMADGRPQRATPSELPPSVVAMVRARLEGLPGAARRWLRAAAVFGNRFWEDGVAALLGVGGESQGGLDAARTARSESGEAAVAPLDVLLAEELVERAPESRFAGQPELRFRQALVREAAYEMLTDRDRVAGHRLAGEWLVARGEGEPAILADHFERGGAWAQACAALARAAAAALEGQDFESALGLVARAERIAPDDLAPEARLALLTVRAEAERWSGDLEAAHATWERAARLSAPGSAEAYAIWGQLAGVAGIRGDFSLPVLWREHLAPPARDPGATRARLFALATAGRRLFQLGDYEAAREVVALIRAETEQGGAMSSAIDPRTAAEIHRLYGSQARHVGDAALDLACYVKSAEGYAAAGDRRGQCNALVSVGFAYAELGCFEQAQISLREAAETAERMGLAAVVTRAEQNLALCAWAARDLARGESLARGVIAAAHARGDQRFEGWTRIYLARIHSAAKRPREALEEASRAAALLESSPPAYAGASAAKARALLGCGEVDEADVAAEEAFAILAEYEGIEEFESLVWLARVEVLLARGSRAARGVAERALARLELRASRIADPALRRSFLERVPDNRELLRLCGAASERADPVPDAVAAAWSATAFDADAAVLVPRLSAHLAGALRGEGGPTRGFPGPDELLCVFERPLGEGPVWDLAELVERVLERSPWQHHPRYLGHQVSAALPRAALFGLLASVLNNGMAAFESGPAITAIERRVVEWALGVIGLSGGGGVMTSGGSLGNLTALLAARQARAGHDVRERGLAGEAPLAVLCSSQVHYSIERAAQIMGLGREGVFTIATDDRFRLRPEAIAVAHDAAVRAGRRPFALVASAGATGVGAVDPLAAAADAARELGLWLHVDGAHGASARLSPRYGAALDGIERADSVVWDAHKLLSMPALSTLVLFADDRAPYATFAQEAAYLFRAGDARWFDVGLRTVECTKPLVALPLYGCLATLGSAPLCEAVERVYDLARELAALLEADAAFELACPPESNIVCFRHLVPGQGGREADAHQRAIVDKLRVAGSFYLVMTTLHGRVWLRTTLMNPLTERRDLEALLGAIKAA